MSRLKHWRVSVESSGDLIVSIEPQMLAGRELTAQDEATIEEAARHLLGFIGRLPQTTDNTETIQALAAKGGDETLRALMDVINERYLQIAVEGWTPEHDDANGAAELAAASGSYALQAYGNAKPKGFAPAWWPWTNSWFKPTTPERDLIKSIALGLAALEAEYRAQAKGGAA